jgi:hypothetical protein
LTAALETEDFMIMDILIEFYDFVKARDSCNRKCDARIHTVIFGFGLVLCVTRDNRNRKA